MLIAKTGNSPTENDQIGHFLSAKIADYNAMPDSRKSLIRMLFRHCIACSDSAFDDLPINFRIHQSIFGQRDAGMSSIVLSNPKPSFSLLSGVVPFYNRTSFHLGKIIDYTAKFYASSGCAVVASRMAYSKTLTKPMLISLDIGLSNDSEAFSLTQPFYKVYAVTFSGESSSSLLKEYDFFDILCSLRSVGSDIFYSPIEEESDCCFVVRLATQFGYKFLLDTDLLKESAGHKTFLCVVSPTAVDRFEEVCKNLNAVSCGTVFEGVEESVFIRNGERLLFSSILVNEIILLAASYQCYGSSSVKLHRSEETFVPQSHHVERSIQDVLENIEYVSPSLLASRFDSCINTYQTSVARSPYVTYFAVKGIGRFMVSLDTYVHDADLGGALDSTLRVIFEHQAYGATPSLALIRLIERTGSNGGYGQRMIDELIRFLDIFSIRCKIEREEIASISADYVLSFGLVSKLEHKVSELMSGFKQKGELIYSIDLASCGTGCSTSSNEELPFSNRIISNLVSSKIVNAISPISRGGLFFSLFSMGESLNLGFDITGDTEQSSEKFLFDDSIGRAVLAVSEEHEAHFVDFMQETGVPITLLGHVTKGEIRIDDVSYGFIADLKKKVSFAFDNNIKKMASKKVVKPYADSQSTKKEQVASMFDNIAYKYDFLNHFLSLGIDKLWRKKLVKEVGKYRPSRILDVATGTGDLAIALSKLRPQNIVGIDISTKMVEVGVEKVKKEKLEGVIFLQKGDSETINFDSSTFDFATVAFGVRNFENPLLGLREMHRVLKPGGGVAVLEFAMPTKFPIRNLYKFYFFRILPFVGRFFSKDRSAYTYLPESVEAFPSGASFLALLKEAGFTKARIIPLTFGVANIYIGEK